MNSLDIEREIVEKYVKKHKQERILWELTNAKKRDAVIWKFAGTNIFKDNCLQKTEYMSSSMLFKYLYEMGASKRIYYIGESFIGEMNLEEAVKKANNGEICIIYCGNGIGYYQGEQEYGSPPRYILKISK